MTDIRGIWAAAISVIDKTSLKLDVESTINHAESIIDSGAHGCVMGGSTSQSKLVDLNSKYKLIEQLSHSKHKDKYIIAPGVDSFLDTVALMKHALKNSFSDFLIMPPSYWPNLSDEGIYLFYAKLIEQCPEVKSICLYNFKKLSRTAFTTDLVEKLAKDFPCINAVKDSGYELWEKIRIDGFAVMVGSESKLLKNLQIGNPGVISAVCNITAPLARSVFDLFQKGIEGSELNDLNTKLCGVRAALDSCSSGLISAIHFIKSLQNKKYETLLPPLMSLSLEEQKALLLKLKKLDFIPKKNIAA